MPIANNRAKFAYINKSDIYTKINSGELDMYDIIYTKDTHENIIITPDLKLCSVMANIYVYASEDEAVSALNHASDTYEGQIIAIKTGEKYRGYIVNLNNNSFYVTPLWETNEPIDYESLTNIPINNIKSIGSPLIISELANGNYSFIGTYKISNNDDTVKSVSEPILFMIRHEVSKTTIKQISQNYIYDFEDNGNELEKKEYITDTYLKDNNFATEDYVNNQIASLHFFTEEEAKEYIDKVLDEDLDGRIATWVDLHLATYQEVNDLLNENEEDI